MIATPASGPDGEGGSAARKSCLALIACVLIAGCGGHASAHKPVARAGPCKPEARAVVAAFAGAQPGSVGAVAGIANSGEPQCVFGVASMRVTALVDTGAQPYFRLERTIVEDSQQFSTVRLEPAPVHVANLGLDAAWFPGEQQVMTTDGTRLITVSVHWPRVQARRRRALATAVARAYLGPLRPSAAEPSGS